MLKQLQSISVGIFDSGVGGLSVWKEAIKILPDHNFLYFSDNAYSPYGPRAVQEIIERAKIISKFLIEKGAGIIVVACNTATAAAIDSLRENFSTPFIGMEPAVKPAAALTKTGVIGVLATKGTFGGSLYSNTLNMFASNLDVVEMVGTGLVPLVESGKVKGKAVQNLLKKYIAPMINRNADYIVLGCTHYSFLKETIEQIAGEGITIIDPAPAVARHLYKVANKTNLIDTHARDNTLGVTSYKLHYCNTQFYSSGDNSVLKSMAREIVPKIPDDYFIKADI